jgi:hypothetical protein
MNLFLYNTNYQRNLVSCQRKELQHWANKVSKLNKKQKQTKQPN